VTWSEIATEYLAMTGDLESGFEGFGTNGANQRRGRWRGFEDGVVLGFFGLDNGGGVSPAKAGDGREWILVIFRNGVEDFFDYLATFVGAE